MEIEVGSTPRQIVVVATLDSTTANALPNGRLERNVGAKLLRLSLSGSAKKVGPAIFGSYQHRGRKLRFSPRFNLVAGESYVATLTLGNGDQHHLRYVVPVKYTRPAPVVIAVYPTADQLPANHLKFYLHFSEPMREGRDIFDKIQLFDGAGTKVIGPWRRQELWNENATRFTLWIHPGRIKNGLALRNE